MRRDIIRRIHVESRSRWSASRTATQRRRGAARRVLRGLGSRGHNGTELKAATLAHIQVGLRRYNGTKINGNDKANLIE